MLIPTHYFHNINWINADIKKGQMLQFSNQFIPAPSPPHEHWFTVTQFLHHKLFLFKYSLLYPEDKRKGYSKMLVNIHYTIQYNITGDSNFYLQ
jgi:hypothetical protein